MAVRLGIAPVAAFALLASIGTAGAQYYPPDQSNQSYAPPPGTAQAPAAYDPYNGPAGGYAAPAQANGNYAPQGGYAPPPGVRDPYAQQAVPQQGYGAQPGYTQQPEPPVAAVPAPNNPYAASPAPGAQQQAGYPTGTYSGQQPAGYGQAGQQAGQQAGYPAGAYSGQPPAGMASPYGNAPQGGYQQQQAAYPSAQQPAANGAVPPGAVSGSSEAQGANGSSIAMLPPEDQPETGPVKELPANLKRQVVDYQTKEAPGTIIIDTPNTYLYYVQGGGKAERYGIGVGREGFTWSGSQKISRKAEWPDWRPPAEMIERQPYLPRFMAGGPGNPMGARALYLGGTIYRIHGTNQPSTIGQFMSSGCIRMLNEDVENLFDKVKVGTKVVVLPGDPPKTAANTAPNASVVPASAPAVSVR